MDNPEHIYDIAVSFADEQREYVEQTVAAAKALGLRVFYDRDFSHEWWGKNFVVEQRKVYGTQALHFVPFISDDYFTKAIPRDEYSLAMMRAIEHGSDYILPVLVGDVAIPSELLHPHTGYLRAEDHTPEQLAVKIKAKVDKLREGGQPARDIDTIIQGPREPPGLSQRTRVMLVLLTGILLTLGVVAIISQMRRENLPSDISDGYSVVMMDRELTVPTSDYCGNDQHIDLDQPNVSASDIPSEIDYLPCEHPAALQIASGSGVAFGYGPATRPQPKECSSSARSRPEGKTSVDSFKPGETAFCVITDQGAIGWLRYIETRDNKLIFQLTLWRPTSVVSR